MIEEIEADNNIKKLEEKKIALFQRAQAYIQEHFKLMGRIEEIDEQIQSLNGKEKEEKKDE